MRSNYPAGKDRTDSQQIGRVAAGAIAEKYLKLAYGIEIVAFVSSVGKIDMPSAVSPPSQVPDDDDDTVEDALSPEFVELLKTVTREQVDAQPTRCPHAETSERMIKVRNLPSLSPPQHTLTPCALAPHSASCAQKRPTTPSAER